MISTRSLIGLIGALVLMTSVVPLPLPAQQLPTVRVGSLPIDEDATAIYAYELGYFKDAGINVEFEPGINNASTALAALANGTIQVTAAAMAGIVTAHSRGIPIKIIAPATLNTEGDLTDVIAVRKDSPIKSGADLNGKTIGIIGLKSMQQVAAMAWVDKHGGDSSTLKFIELPLPLLCPQVVAGRVDASLPIEPFVTACKSDIHILGNVLSGIAPRLVSLAFVSSDSWLAANPDVANRFVSALHRAATWANTHHAESAAILIRYAKLDPAIATTMARATYTTSIDASLIQPSIDASARYGVIAKPFPASELLWTPPH
jgi:NitT/TauT family transport system substrate-binding protein